MVVAQRQGHQLIEIDAALPVERQQLRRHRREFQATLHRQHLHTESRGHVFDAFAFVDQRLESLELVGRVHGLPAAVLGQTDFHRTLRRHQLAQHLVRLRQPAPLLQQQQRSPPTLARSDRELDLARVSPSGHLFGDHQVVQQSLRVDERRQLLDLTR